MVIVHNLTSVSEQAIGFYDKNGFHQRFLLLLLCPLLLYSVRTSCVFESLNRLKSIYAK